MKAKKNKSFFKNLTTKKVNKFFGVMFFVYGFILSFVFVCLNNKPNCNILILMVIFISVAVAFFLVYIFLLIFVKKKNITKNDLLIKKALMKMESDDRNKKKTKKN